MFKTGLGMVIKCWDEGFVGLKKGSKAELVCPPEMAYGSKARGAVIKANSTLLFTIEIIDVYE